MTQCTLHQACRPTGEASCFEPLAPQAVTAFFKREHLDLRRESNDIPHTDRSLSWLSIDGIRCMVSD